MQSPVDQFDALWERGLIPNVEDFVTTHGPVLLPQLTQLLLIDQSRHWARNQRIPAEQYFRRFPSVRADPESAIDLLFAEFLQLEEVDANLSIDEFVSAYPELADELRRQIEFHRSFHSEPLAPLSACTVASPMKSDKHSEVSIPGYEILNELGRGGLGVVYLARDLRLNRMVAIKMLLAGKFASAGLLKRFMLEAEATARLQHPNIVQIYEVGQYEGRPFLALEYVSGGTLSRWLNGTPQSPMDAARIVHDIALAIHFAHGQGVIHRDLKPSNLLIQNLPPARSSRDDGTDNNALSIKTLRLNRSVHGDKWHIKVADFGLAKLTEVDSAISPLPTTITGDLMGTAAYMSPEQALAGAAPGRAASPLTCATDIYSLGAILYELLTGRPPFVGVQPLEVLSQVIADEPIRPSQLVRHIPRDLQTICLKCLEKNASRRYSSAAALAEDIQRFMNHQPILGQNVSTIERGWRWCRRNPVITSWVALVASILLMLAAIGGIYSFMLGNQLALKTKSEFVEMTLKNQALGLVWESSLSQADALRTSHLVGQRFESLEAIERARVLGDSISLDPSRIDRMRNATVAALALSDVCVEKEFKKKWPDDVPLVAIDAALTVGAYWLKPNVVVVVDIVDGTELARIEDAEQTAMLVLNSNASKLAIIGKHCRVYDLTAAKLKCLFDSASGGSWTFMPDGQSMIGTDDQGVLQIVDLQNTANARKVGRFADQQQIEVSPNSELVAMWIDGSIQIVELATGKLILRLPASIRPPSQAFAWHPNSKVLAIVSESGDFELWSIDGTRLKSMRIAGPFWFCFDAIGDRLLSYNYWNQSLELWNVGSGELELRQKGEHYIGRTAESGGGIKLLKQTENDRVAHCNVTCPTVFRMLLTLHGDSIGSNAEDMAYSPDGRMFAYSSRDSFEIYDTQTLISLGRTFAPDCFLRFDPHGTLITSIDAGIDESGNSRRQIHRWQRSDVKDADHDRSSKIVFGPPSAIGPPQTGYSEGPFEVSKDGKQVVICRNDGMQLMSLEDMNIVQSQTAHPDVRRTSISPDGLEVATAGWNAGNVCIWDARSGQLKHTLNEPDLCTTQFSPDGKLLATNSKSVKLWDAHSWQLLRDVKVSGRPNNGVSICFSPDSRTLAVSDSNGCIHLQDALSGEEFLLLTSPSEVVTNQLSFSPDGRQLAVLASNKHTVCIWQLDVIQAQLDKRGLVSQRRITESANSNQAFTDHAGLPNPLKIELATDERFEQFEANQLARRARKSIAELDFNSARASIAKALALKPKNAATCNGLAWLLSTGPAQLRDPHKAVELALSAIENADSKRVGLYMNTLGVAQYRENLYEQAKETLAKSLAMQAAPSQPFDLYFLAMCCARLGDHEGANDYFKQAETLRALHRSKLSAAQLAELDQFSEEANLLLAAIRHN